MADHTDIAWTDMTWNPTRGCSRVSAGCEHCYAEEIAARFNKNEYQPYHGLINKHGKWNGSIKVVPHQLDAPLRKSKPRRIFVNSMSDLFHENTPMSAIDDVFAVMAMAPRHTFQVLTKRPAYMRAYMKDGLTPARIYNAMQKLYHSPLCKNMPELGSLIAELRHKVPAWPPQNVWLGVSAENQETWDERSEDLLCTPAAIHFVSAEPLLGPINLRDLTLPELAIGGMTLDWVIAGGESGRGHRDMDPEWAISLFEQCQGSGTAFFMKQDSGRGPGQQGRLPLNVWQCKQYPLQQGSLL